MENYNIEDHIHNYAVWTAARAVQRGFNGANTDSISDAINKASLKNTFFEKREWSKSEFEKEHKKCIEIIRECLKKSNCTYGQAAKIIAIYLKTAVVIPNRGEDNLSRIIHPPIDRILLNKLKLKNANDKTPNWTELDEPEYLKIINDIRNILGDLPMWKIEKYWHV